MKRIILILTTLFLSVLLYANGKDSTKIKSSADEKKETNRLTALLKTLDSAEKKTHYQTGNIALSNGVAHLNMPKGFKFIDAEKSRFILENLWKNLPDPKVIGMIVKDSFHLNSLKSDWAFIVSYDEMGFVKDDDAGKIKYDDLLTDLKKDQEEANAERKKLGYDAMHLTGWAASPYYDKQNKVLHWAKAYKVDTDEDTTLNYDIRVLGRKGVLSLNAIATMDQFDEVEKNIPDVLQMAQFDKGYKYEEYDSGIDKVAAWTIGGLIAGKILVKIGMFAGLLKFWKLFMIAIAGAFAAIKRFVTGKKKEHEMITENALGQNKNAGTI